MISFFDASALIYLIEGKEPFGSRMREKLAAAAKEHPGLGAAVSRWTWLESRVGPMKVNDSATLATCDAFSAQPDLMWVELSMDVVELAAVIRVRLISEPRRLRAALQVFQLVVRYEGLQASAGDLRHQHAVDAVVGDQQQVQPVVARDQVVPRGAHAGGEVGPAFAADEAAVRLHRTQARKPSSLAGKASRTCARRFSACAKALRPWVQAVFRRAQAFSPCAQGYPACARRRRPCTPRTAAPGNTLAARTTRISSRPIHLPDERNDGHPLP